MDNNIEKKSNRQANSFRGNGVSNRIRLPLEGKLSAGWLTDEVSSGQKQLNCHRLSDTQCVWLGGGNKNRFSQKTPHPSRRTALPPSPQGEGLIGRNLRFL